MMSDPRVISDTAETRNTIPTSSRHSLAELLNEIEQTPPEYWPNLLEIIRQFRQSVAQANKISANPDLTEIVKMSKSEKIERNKSIIDLINSWVEEGDEQEQTETAEYLRKALDENRISNRPLFP
jgi:hypothetical protein